MGLTREVVAGVAPQGNAHTITHVSGATAILNNPLLPPQEGRGIKEKTDIPTELG